MKKRLLSLVLALAILFTSVDVTVLAEDITSVNMNTVESHAIAPDELESTNVVTNNVATEITEIDYPVSEIETETVTDIPVTSITDTKTSETSGACGDNLTWSYANKTLTIYGTGARYDYNFEIEHGDTAP